MDPERASKTGQHCLNSLMTGHLSTIEQAATLMGVSTRHTRLAFWRLTEGTDAAAIAHGNRGR